jgi:hypothetical protein
MNIQTKIITLLLAMAFFSQGCAVFIGDDFHHRHFRHHRYGSLQAPHQEMVWSQVALNTPVEPVPLTASE